MWNKVHTKNFPPVENFLSMLSFNIFRAADGGGFPAAKAGKEKIRL
jgi:hypothetical protein